jgi:hypothetical protein
VAVRYALRTVGQDGMAESVASLRPEQLLRCSFEMSALADACVVAGPVAQIVEGVVVRPDGGDQYASAQIVEHSELGRFFIAPFGVLLEAVDIAVEPEDLAPRPYLTAHNFEAEHYRMDRDAVALKNGRSAEGEWQLRVWHRGPGKRRVCVYKHDPDLGWYLQDWFDRGPDEDEVVFAGIAGRRDAGENQWAGGAAAAVDNVRVRLSTNDAEDAELVRDPLSDEQYWVVTVRGDVELLGVEALDSRGRLLGEDLRLARQRGA